MLLQYAAIYQIELTLQDDHHRISLHLVLQDRYLEINATLQRSALHSRDLSGEVLRLVFYHPSEFSASGPNVFGFSVNKKKLTCFSLRLAIEYGYENLTILISRSSLIFRRCLQLPSY